MIHVDSNSEMSQADVASEVKSVELPGMETRSKLKRMETRLRKQRDHAREKCKRIEREVEALLRQLMELEEDEVIDADDGRELSL